MLLKLETGVPACSNEQNKEQFLPNVTLHNDSIIATFDEHYVQSYSKHNSIWTVCLEGAI